MQLHLTFLHVKKLLSYIIPFAKAKSVFFVYIDRMKNKENKENKKPILEALAKLTKKLRGNKSQFMFGSENDIAPSIISTVERVMKDPQLTTVFKIAEAFNMKTSEFIKLIEDELPENFSLIEK